jgi:molecular chaperone GrpE
VSPDQNSDEPDRPDEWDRVVIRDNRKIDPVTGELRKPAAERADTPSAAGEPANEPDQGPMVEAALLDERTRDLQRVQAEYANYRKRAERDRLLAGDLAIGRTLVELLPVIDDLDRAKAHGDLTGPLKAVADKLDGVFAKHGLVAFGEVGDPFDPSIHEAVLHDESDTVTVPTCTTVMRQGYTHKERLLRPAMVGVTDPSTSTSTTNTPREVPAESQGAHNSGTDPEEVPMQPDEAEVPASNDPAETNEK